MGTPTELYPLPGSQDDAQTALLVALDLLAKYLEARDRSDLLAEQVENYIRGKVESFGDKKPPDLPPNPGPFPLPPSARRLGILRYPNGSATIQIDSEKPFRLPRGLTDFLERLASDAGESEDDLVAWKSRAWLREWLQTQSGKAVSAKLVNKRVYDLREHLKQAGIKGNWVQTHTVKGVRFALMRGSARILRAASGGR